jgi:hypothetical protein
MIDRLCHMPRMSSDPSSIGEPVPETAEGEAVRLASLLLAVESLLR